MDTFTIIQHLDQVVTTQPEAIVSRVFFKGEHLNATLFAFDTGQELTDHSAGYDAIIHILHGTAEFGVSGTLQMVEAGTWVHMQANTPHSVKALTPLTFLLLLQK